MEAWSELALFLVVLTVLTPVLGGYMAAIFEGGPHAARRLLGPCERLIYRACRIDAARERRSGSPSRSPRSAASRARAAGRSATSGSI
jgi:K+-transporting ATPase A subunit